MARNKPDPEKKICETALRLAASHGWKDLTLEQIARAAKIPLPRVKALFPEKNRIIPALVGWIDACAGAAMGKIDASGPPRDRLFEAMMGRFDILQKHRAGVLAILRDGCNDPRMACRLVPAQLRTIRQIIAWARLAPKEIHAPLVMLGLLAVHYRTLWEWRKDTTHDMAKTMATLDMSLRSAGKAAEVLFRASK